MCSPTLAIHTHEVAYFSDRSVSKKQHSECIKLVLMRLVTSNYKICEPYIGVCWEQNPFEIIVHEKMKTITIVKRHIWRFFCLVVYTYITCETTVYIYPVSIWIASKAGNSNRFVGLNGTANQIAEVLVQFWQQEWRYSLKLLAERRKSMFCCIRQAATWAMKMTMLQQPVHTDLHECK